MFGLRGFGAARGLRSEGYAFSQCVPSIGSRFGCFATQCLDVYREKPSRYPSRQGFALGVAPSYSEDIGRFSA